MLRLHVFISIWMAMLFMPTNVQADQALTLTEAYDERKGWLVSQGIIQQNNTPAHINRLIYQHSPYLLSHSLQPVNWVAWNDSPFTTAQQLNKLVYLSIGYSTCHWCHVIAKESYQNYETATILNSHYISIKLDREQHPHVDRMYHLALSRMMPSPGWPIQVVLTPDGNILWIDSYTPTEKLKSTLEVLALKWQKNPTAITAIAANKHKLLLPSEPKANLYTDIKTIKQNDAGVISDIIAILQHEQLGNGPRFLRSEWLLFLLNEQPSQLNLVTEQVEQLLTSNTYDFVEGGMHRYAEDGHWMTPHYEKMLYDQALLITLLNRLYLHTASRVYLDFAYHVVEFVETFLKSPVGYVSSLSASSSGIEGHYYQFSGESAHPANGEYGWVKKGNAVRLTSLGLPIKDKLQALVKIRAGKVRPKRDGKSILSWNALYLQAINDLFLTTQDAKLLNIGNSLADSLYSGFYQRGELFRINFQSEISTPATLEDYALLIISLRKWYLTTRNKRYLEFISEVMSKFVEQIKQANWSGLKQDAQIQSPAALVVSALSKLQELGLIEEGHELISTMDTTSLSVEEASLQFALSQRYKTQPDWVAFIGNGRGIVTVTPSKSGGTIKLAIDQDWHINANTPMSGELIATQLIYPQEAGIEQVYYPEGKIKQLGFSATPLKLYEGEVQISYKYNAKKNRVNALNYVTLELQMCSESMCLLPEQIKLYY